MNMRGFAIRDGALETMVVLRYYGGTTVLALPLCKMCRET